MLLHITPFGPDVPCVSCKTMVPGTRVPGTWYLVDYQYPWSIVIYQGVAVKDGFYYKETELNVFLIHRNLKVLQQTLYKGYQVPFSPVPEMTIWTQRIFTPSIQYLNQPIHWLALTTKVTFHLWHDHFEYYYAGIQLGRNCFGVKLIPPISNPQIQKFDFFTGELDSIMVHIEQS